MVVYGDIDDHGDDDSVTAYNILSQLHRRNPTAVTHRGAQHRDSKNEHSAVAARTSTAL